MKEIRIFSGRSYQELGERICVALNIKLSPTEIKPYTNGCFEMILRDRVWECYVFLVQTSISQTLHRDIWELFQMISAAKENLAHEITVIMPYVSYARSDKERGDEKYIRGMAVAGKILIKLLHASGVARFIGIDFHSKAFERFFAGSYEELPMRFNHLSALPLFVEYLKTKKCNNVVVLPADDGAFEKSQLLAQKLRLPLAITRNSGKKIKERIDDGKVQIGELGNADVAGREVVVLDDEIATGTTMRALGEKLQELKANSLIILATHGLFVGKTIENLKSLDILKEIVVTDTVPISDEVMKPLPIKVLPVAGLIAEKIKEISEES